MLTVEEQQKSLRYCVELDHCYTSRTSSADPVSSDPLPIANSPDINDFEFKHNVLSQQPAPVVSTTPVIVSDVVLPSPRIKLPVRPNVSFTVIVAQENFPFYRICLIFFLFVTDPNGHCAWWKKNCDRGYSTDIRGCEAYNEFDNT